MSATFQFLVFLIPVTQNHMHGTNTSRELSFVFFHPSLISQCNILSSPSFLCSLPSSLFEWHLIEFPFCWMSLGDICWCLLFCRFPYLSGTLGCNFFQIPRNACIYFKKYVLRVYCILETLLGIGDTKIWKLQPRPFRTFPKWQAPNVQWEQAGVRDTFNSDWELAQSFPEEMLLGLALKTK